MSKGIKNDIIHELFRPARMRYRRRHYTLKGLGDLWEIDLMDLRQLKNSNKGYQYVLVAIDAFSKYVYAVILKNKSGPEVMWGMKKLLDLGKKPRFIQSDRGTEFYNRYFKKLMSDNSITHYSTYSKIKCAHAERVIRTLKNMLFKQLHINGSYTYLKLIQRIVDEYNHRKHRTIKMAPSEVNKNNEKHILENIYTNLKPFDSIKRHNREVLKQGDFVRLSRERAIFDKAYIPQWSAEIFKIIEVKRTNPITYILEDLTGQTVKGCFYNEELQKTKYKDTYLVEKIMKRKNGKALIKWLGFTSPSWVDESDIIV